MIGFEHILDIILELPREAVKKVKELIKKDVSAEKEYSSVPAGTPFIGIELLEKLEVPKIIDEVLGEKHTSLDELKGNRYKEKDEEVVPSVGTILSVVIADMIAKPKEITRIYKVEEISDSWKLFELFGINPQKLNDDKILRSMSKLGTNMNRTNEILLKLVLNVSNIYGVPLESFFLDSTVLELDGGFEDADKVTAGRGAKSHSQLITSLLVASKSKIAIGGFVYSGNTNDATTLPDAIEVINKVVPKVNEEATIELAMDRIYITAKNVQIMDANEKVKIKWLGPLKSGLSETKFRKIVDEAYEKNLWQKISYRSPKEIARNDSPMLEAFETTWIMSEEIKPELEPGQKRRPNGSIKKIEIDVRCVVYKDPKKAYNEKKKREEKRQKLEKKLVEFSNKINKRNLKTVEECKKALDKILNNYPGFENFLEINLSEINLNEQTDEKMIIFKYAWKENIYKKEENYDGLFALLTAYSKEEKDSNALIGIYRTRNEVEMNFRDLKGILDLERLFVREPERIDAYIFLKILAYFVLAFLRWYLLEKCDVKTTERRVQEALGNINIVEGEFSSSKIPFCGITGDNMLNKLIREKFGLANPYKSINEINDNNIKKVVDWLRKKAENCSDIAENSE
jgi:hypothetical protein